MKRLVTAFLIMLVLTAACSKGVKKVSDDSKMAVEAFAAADAIRDAYVKGDNRKIELYTTRDGYRTIISVMKKFDSAELSFNPTWVEIDSGRTLLHVGWKGKWKKGDDVFDERGAAVFVLRDRPLRVDNILRSNPFRYPE